MNVAIDGFGGLYLLRVKVGCSPELVDVRLRGQAISTPLSPSRVTSLAFRLVPLSSIVNGCLQQSVL